MPEPVSGPEVIIGLVGAIGTDLDVITEAIANAFSEFAYKAVPIKLSALMHDIVAPPWNQLSEKAPGVESRWEHMTGGNDLRRQLKRGDALAMLAVGAIRDIRQDITGSATKPAPRRAYILRSLKHPSEVSTLRSIYGPSFFLIAAYSSREVRKRNVAQKLAEANFSIQPNQFFDDAERLMKRDQSERETDDFGQNVTDTFAIADVFVDANDHQNARREVSRFVQLLFGTEIHTPTRDEYGIFHAEAARVRSAALGRQVGATITTVGGDVVAVGTNEVPKPGGGLYWCDDDPDLRDFRFGYEISDRLKKRVLGDLLKRLRDRHWLNSDRSKKEIEELVNEALSDPDGNPVMKGSHLGNAIEYFRAVHAEMAAIVDAARRGVAIRDCVLYTTTFPCHDCAKHIVAAGIQRVVYVEPYPKSLAPELYPDSIAIDERRRKSMSVDSAATMGAVRFDSFTGVAPRQYMTLFVMSDRKNKAGDVLVPNKGEANPRFYGELPPMLSLRVKEDEEFNRFKDQMQERIPQQQKIPTASSPNKHQTTNGGESEVRRA